MAESKIDQIKALLTENPDMGLSAIRKYFEAKNEKFSPPSYYEAKAQMEGGKKPKKTKMKLKRSNREPAMAAKDDRRPSNPIKSVIAAHGTLRQPVEDALKLLGSPEQVMELVQSMLG